MATTNVALTTIITESESHFDANKTEGLHLVMQEPACLHKVTISYTDSNSNAVQLKVQIINHSTDAITSYADIVENSSYLLMPGLYIGDGNSQDGIGIMSSIISTMFMLVYIRYTSSAVTGGMYTVSTSQITSVTDTIIEL